MFDKMIFFVSRLFSNSLIKKYPEIDHGDADKNLIRGFVFVFMVIYVLAFFLILITETDNLCLILIFLAICSTFCTIPSTAIAMRIVYSQRIKRMLEERSRNIAEQQVIERYVPAPKLSEYSAQPKPSQPEKVQPLQPIQPEPVKEPEAEEYAVVGNREIESASEIKSEGQIRLKKRRCEICGTPISKDDLTCPNIKNH